MDGKAAKKIVDGVGKQTAISVRRLAKRHLSHLAALRVKLCLSFLLYGISFAVIAVLFSASEGTLELSRIDIHDVSSTSLLIWLKDCTMDLKVQDGSSISITETTTEFDPNRKQLHVDWNETADVLSITCSGPASDYGDAVTVVVEIGHTIHFQTFEVVFEPGGGRSLFRSNFSGLDNESLGDKVSASGDEGVIQMYYATMGSLSVQLDHGFVFLYEVNFADASFVLGGQVDIYLWQETWQAGLDINIQTGDGQNTSSGLCISDWSSRPLPQISNLDGYDYVFSVGSGANRRPMNIIRNSALSRLYLQSGVWRSQRHCNNTFDSVIRIDSQLEDSFKAWAAVAETRSELLNLWLMGPSLGSEIQSMTSDGFWIFSRFGDALMWFPSGLWNIFTVGLFTLRTSRGTFLVKDSLCTTKHDRLTAGRPKNSTETLWHQQTMERCAKALRHSLPDGLNLTNDRNGRVYYVDRTFADTVNPFPSLADGAVSIMSSSTSAFVKVDHGPDNLRGPWGLLFSVVMVILALAGGILDPILLKQGLGNLQERNSVDGTFACAVVVTLYKMQKRRYLKARSVDLRQGNPGLREMLDLESQCNLLLTLVRCLILRSPSGKGTITVQKVIEICMGHFVVMQLLVTPMVLIAILNTNNMAELRASCNFNEWVTGGCLNVRNRALSTTMLTASITMNSIYFLNTLLEYTTRYALNKAEETGDCGSMNKFAMKLRASKAYRVFVAVCLMLSLFFFCSYVVLGVIMVLLGTLLQPERLSPVLLAVAGAVIIAQQVTLKFDEFVEQAKVMAAEWLEKHADAALKSAQEVIGQLEGVADSALNSMPFAKDALDRMGVNPDAFSAELVMGKARQAAEVVVDSAADQVYQMGAEADATGSFLRSAKDVQSSSQAMLAQVAESLPGKVVTEAEHYLQPAATALAQTMLEKLEPGSRSLLEQASTKAGVDPSAILHTLQASSKAGVDPAVIMQAVRGSGEGSFASARSLIEEASSKAGVDPSTMMQALQASTDAGVDFSVLMQGCGAADQLKDLASSAQSSIEDVKLKGVNAATFVGNSGITGEVTDRVVEMNVPLTGIMEEAVGNSAQLLGVLDDLEAGEVFESHGHSLDLENFLVMLGLSKGQLLLLNINAVLLFLSCVSFILIGSTLFLGGGIDALIPQLSATAGTLGTTVAAIRAKSKEFKDADLSSMSEAFQDATSQLRNPMQDNEEKKQQ